MSGALVVCRGQMRDEAMAFEHGRRKTVPVEVAEVGLAVVASNACPLIGGSAGVRATDR